MVTRLPDGSPLSSCNSLTLSVWSLVVVESQKDTSPSIAIEDRQQQQEEAELARVSVEFHYADGSIDYGRLGRIAIGPSTATDAPPEFAHGMFFPAGLNTINLAVCVGRMKRA